MPLKMISKNDGRILEAGCGAGRILKYFHNKQFDIIGIDFIENAIEKLKKDNQDLKVYVDDIKSPNSMINILNIFLHLDYFITLIKA